MFHFVASEILGLCAVCSVVCQRVIPSIFCQRPKIRNNNHSANSIITYCHHKALTMFLSVKFLEGLFKPQWGLQHTSKMCLWYLILWPTSTYHVDLWLLDFANMMRLVESTKFVLFWRNWSSCCIIFFKGKPQAVQLARGENPGSNWASGQIWSSWLFGFSCKLRST